MDALLTEALPALVRAHTEGRRSAVDALLASAVATVRASLLPALATLAAGGPHGTLETS